jgi:superfamily I DNA/RNA helicase
MDLAREAGVQTPGDREDPAFWDLRLPEYLGEAVDRLGPRFDALVVDEAQDFGESWWLPLQMLLRDPDHGVIYVFYDDNQAIYRKPGGLPDGLVSARLTETGATPRRSWMP